MTLTAFLMIMVGLEVATAILAFVHGYIVGTYRERLKPKEDNA